MKKTHRLNYISFLTSHRSKMSSTMFNLFFSYLVKTNYSYIMTSIVQYLKDQI